MYTLSFQLGTMAAERSRGWWPHQSRGDFRIPRSSPAQVSSAAACPVKKNFTAMFIQVALGSAIMGIVGLGLANNKTARWAFTWFVMQIKYNVVAIHEICDDYIQRRNNKTGKVENSSFFFLSF